MATVLQTPQGHYNDDGSRVLREHNGVHLKLYSVCKGKTSQI